MVPQRVPVDWAQLPTVVTRSMMPLCQLSPLPCYSPQGLLFLGSFLHSRMSPNQGSGPSFSRRDPSFISLAEKREEGERECSYIIHLLGYQPGTQSPSFYRGKIHMTQNVPL